MSESIFDKASLVNRMMGDEELAREIIGVFLDDVPNKIAILKQALENREASDVRDHAHAIKGAAMNTSALALKDIAYLMEEAGEAADIDKAITLMPEIEKQFELLKDTLVQAGLA